MKRNTWHLLKVGFTLLLLAGVFLAYVPVCQALERNGTRQIRLFVIPQEGGIVEPEPGDYGGGVWAGDTASGETFTLQRDQTITFTAQAKPGYVFNGWYLNGNYEGDLEVITVTMNQNYELHAIFSGPGAPGLFLQQDQTLDWASVALAAAALATSIIVAVVVLTRLKKNPESKT